MARGISLPKSAAKASCGERSSEMRQLPDGAEPTGFRGCQSPTDSFFDPRSCQSPMDRFFEGPQVPSFFGPNGQGSTAQPSNCLMMQGVPSQGMASTGPAPMVPFGAMGFQTWPGQPGVYFCPAGTINPNGVPMAAIPAPVAMPPQGSGMTMPVQMAANVPSRMPMALPAGAVAGPGMAEQVGIPPHTMQPTMPQAAAPAKAAPPKREPLPDPAPPLAGLASTEAKDLVANGGPENRPPCPTAIYVDLTCLREKAH